VLAAVVPFVLLTLLGLALLWPSDDARPSTGDLGFPKHLVRGTVRSVEPTPCASIADGGVGEDPREGEELAGDEAPLPEEPADAPGECVSAVVRLTDGDNKGQDIRLDVPVGPATIEVETGTKLVMSYVADAPPELQYQITDVQRSSPLIVLAVLFAIVVVAFGRKRGLSALAGLAVTFVVLARFVLPALLAGESPVPVALVGASVIMFVALYITHGFTVRTSVAVLGTLSSLLLTGLLASVFTAWGSITGLASEEANFLGSTQAQLDLRGLFLAGVVIGALGVLDDVTVTQTAAVWELRAANREYGVGQLYRAGVRIGRDHIASTVNTLVLAYAGASLPLLILFSVSGRGLADTLTSEIIAQEVVRALVGSIGLVASVPVTTMAAALVAVRDDGIPRRPRGQRPTRPRPAPAGTGPALPRDEGLDGAGARPSRDPDPTEEWVSRLRSGD
jgi:uncharacterized membrane protein